VKSRKKNLHQFLGCVFNTCNEFIKYSQTISGKVNSTVCTKEGENVFRPNMLAKLIKKKNMKISRLLMKCSI